MKPTILVISCAHGSNEVPKKYWPLFEDKELLLQTSRAYDIGAKYITQHLHKNLGCDAVEAKVTRLLIDCDHSPHHARCFSRYSKGLSADKKQALIKTYYEPFHHDLQEKIAAHIAQGQQVLHLSIFTFTPILRGLFLKTAIGVLYDAHRHAEKEVARILHGLLDKETPPYKIRHNFHFLGTHDYIINSFRKKYAEQDYLGIKLGINQALVPNAPEQAMMCKILAHALHELLNLL